MGNVLTAHIQVVSCLVYGDLFPESQSPTTYGFLYNSVDLGSYLGTDRSRGDTWIGVFVPFSTHEAIEHNKAQKTLFERTECPASRNFLKRWWP